MASKGGNVKTKVRRRVYKLDGARMDLIIVPGPHPYLWVGDDSPDGHGPVAYTGSTRKLRQIHEAIGNALAEAEE